MPRRSKLKKKSLFECFFLNSAHYVQPVISYFISADLSNSTKFFLLSVFNKMSLWQFAVLFLFSCCDKKSFRFITISRNSFFSIMELELVKF